MKKNSIMPHQTLRKYIDRYWIGEGYDGMYPTIIPGTGMELYFNFFGAPIFCNEQKSYRNLANSYIACLRSKAFNIQKGSKLNFIAVRFRAGMFRNFCDFPINELTDTFIDMKFVLNYGNELTAKVIESKTIVECVSILDKYFLDLLEKYYKPDSAMDYAVNEIYYKRSVSMKSLAQYLNISDRQFERRFKQNIGINPKSFQRIARFQSTMKEILLNKQSTYLDIAYKNSYYDQSHFLRDFRYFVGKTPSDFLQEKNFMSHFYNPTRTF